MKGLRTIALQVPHKYADALIDLADIIPFATAEDISGEYLFMKMMMAREQWENNNAKDRRANHG